MSRRVRVASFTLGALTGLPSLALATTEPPTAVDSRATAMGSTAVAHVHNGAAVYHNAAALHEVETLTLSATLAMSRITQTAPGLGESDPSTIPLFLLGGGYRLSEKFVLGLAAFTTGGFGGTYETPAGPFEVALGAMEVSPTLTYSLTEKLAIGVGYRVVYAFQHLDQPPMPIPGLPVMAPRIESDLSGFNFLGLHAGLYFRPIERLKLGFAYRSRVTVEFDGTTDTLDMMGNPVEYDTTSEFTFPHSFKLGGQFEVLEESLFVAGEIRYLLHSSANEEIVTELEGGTPPRIEQTLDWQDSTSFAVGAEYFLLPILPVRGGYMVTMSATPEDRPGAFFPAPGPLHSVHFGAGVRVPAVDVDVGGFYSWGGTETDAPEPPAAPGEYTMKVLALSASVTFRN